MPHVPAHDTARRAARRAALAGSLLAAAATCARPVAAQPAAPQAAASLTPPEPKARVDAIYPAGEDREVDVVLVVTIDTDGRVSDVSVDTSGGAAFDAAAIKAAHQWRFVPAMSDGAPVRAKIKLGFHFDPPPAPTISPTPSPVSPAPSPPPAPAPAPPPAPRPPTPQEVHVRGHSHLPSRGAGDYEIAVGKLAHVPHGDAASLLRLAPGTFLTNEGGTGHPYQVFLRGFDAREGQDIEFTLDGMPINEPGSPHGNGQADTHFIIPELVRSLRVIEGPFAPQQGNFAVAGSARYDVGLREPGLRAKATAGSFATKRLLLTWHPRGASQHTFGGVEAFTSDGFGQNRQSQRATAMGGYEGALGQTGLFRILLTSYLTHYGAAGVLREDDVASGKKGFFDTYDTGQGGDSSRHSVVATLEDKLGGMHWSQSAFFVLRDFRARQNFTGFLEDPQEPWQSPHPQRGDLIDQSSHTITFGGRGSGRERFDLFGFKQQLELGYFARYDAIEGLQQRDRAGTNVPYRTDANLDSSLGNLGMYADASLRPGVPWITLRGGGRIDLYAYRVHDLCAVRAQASTSAVTPDAECFSADRSGYRSRDQTSSTSAGIFQPRGTLLLGPFRGFTFSGSVGKGSRSLGPQYVNQDLKTPFAEVVAEETGVTYRRPVGAVDLQVKSVFFQTHVDHDLFFNQTVGRNTLADGTTRTGWAGSARATGDFFDLAGSATLVRATFDDTNLLIPYAPPVVLRTDGVLFGDLPVRIGGKKLVGSLGAGVSYVAPRPLPYDERSDAIFTVDLSASVRYRAVALGLIATNVLDRRYRLAQYNYASSFDPDAYPSRVAARHFVAGAPRAVYATFSVTLDPGES